MRHNPERSIFGNPAWPYVGPFAVLMLLLALARFMPGGLAYPVRTVAVAVSLLIWSRPLVSFRPSRPWTSILTGIVVFVIWIGPDLLWPGYRQHWLFHNALTGAAATSGERPDGIMLFFRAAGSVLVVPLAEELFWRGWLMRWLISNRFEKVPLGAFSLSAFLITALLFAAEHGPYWDVGFLAGVLYGYWMVRTRSLADCILAHAVTNACLAGYVIAAGRWAFWL